MAQHVPPSAHTRIYTCNWDWCRLAFPTNPSLVYHVIHDHVRKAQPVRRRDLPFLRRVEDGVGESWRLSGSVGVDDDNPHSTLPPDSNSHHSQPSSSQLASSLHHASPMEVSTTTSADASPLPTFNTHVANAVRALTAGFGFGGRDAAGANDPSQNQLHTIPSPTPSPQTKNRLTHTSVSPEPPTTSQTSQERVEQELTQPGSDDEDLADVAMDVPESEPDLESEGQPRTAPTSPSNPLGRGEKYTSMEEPDAELEWPEDMVMTPHRVKFSRSQLSSVVTNTRLGDTQEREADDEGSGLSLSTPFVVQTQTPASPSLSKQQRHQNPPRRSRSPAPQYRHESEHRRINPHPTRKPRRSFHSGSLTLDVSSGDLRVERVLVNDSGSAHNLLSELLSSQDGGDADVDADESWDLDREADPFVSQAPAVAQSHTRSQSLSHSPSQSQSQSQSQTGSRGTSTYFHLPLQTQAPYQSQSQIFSSSQSQSEI